MSGEAMRLFVFGCGYSASRFVEEIRGEAEIAGLTTRSGEKIARFSAAGLPAFLFDGEAADALSPELAEALCHATHLLLPIAPGEAGDPAARLLGERLREAMPELAWIGYLSTVGVYGDHGGAWVDEASPLRPVSKRSMERVAAEEAWRAIAERAGVPLAILRLSGIYGPGRNAFVNLAGGTARRLVKPGQVFNRIHVDDIAGALALLARKRRGGVFNVTDDEPAPPQDVVAFAAHLAGVEPPPEIPFEKAELTPMARSFYGENKRVSNARLKAAGHRFRHPDYRAGLTSLLPEFQRLRRQGGRKR